MEDRIFDRLFCGRKDEIYLEDLSEDLQNEVKFGDEVYAREVDRSTVQGIHGILHTHPKAKVSILNWTLINIGRYNLKIMSNCNLIYPYTSAILQRC